MISGSLNPKVLLGFLIISEGLSEEGINYRRQCYITGITEELLYSIIMENSCNISLEYVKSTVILIRICILCVWHYYCISDLT